MVSGSIAYSMLVSSAFAARLVAHREDLAANSILCRCELADGKGAFVDCLNEKSKDCPSNAELGKRLKSVAKQMGSSDVEHMDVNCRAISINGDVLENQNYFTIINTDRVVPAGLPMCLPNALETLAGIYLEGTAADGAPLQFRVEPSKPQALSKECMYCEGKRKDLETECCSPVSDFTGLEMPKQCRYMTDTGGYGKYFTPIQRSTVDDVIMEGRDPGDLCCSGRAVFSMSRHWECRKTIGQEELLWQMKVDNVDRQYRKSAFHRYMWDIYRTKVLPVEQTTLFDVYDTAPMTSGEVIEKPMIMLVGPYSSGKTSFINHFIGEPYKGSSVGVEPTTNTFTVVQSGQESKIPGFALAADPNNNYQGVARELGIGFQRHFEAAQAKRPILRDLTFLDTPGVLAGSKQKKRGYDFIKAIDFFAARADVILVFFDVQRMDLNDNMGEVLRAVNKAGRHRKVRILLNKADMLEPAELMRVYGTIMWYMSKHMDSPEVPHIYIGNFGGFEYKNKQMAELFDANREDLYENVLSQMVPATSATAKVDRFIERIRRVRAHALLMDRMRTVAKKALPHQKKGVQRKLIRDLPASMKQVSKRKGINLGDFQEMEALSKKMEADDELKMARIPNLDKKMMKALDQALSSDLPRLVEAVGTTYEIEVDSLTQKALGK